MSYPIKVIPMLLAAFLLPEMFSFHNNSLSTEAHPMVLNKHNYGFIDNSISVENVTSVTTINENGVVECKMCSYVATELNATLFHNPKVLGVITSDIEKICTFLPTTVQNDCTNAAINIAPVILEQIGEFVANEGCIELGICPSST